jgi:hypothetical protein
MRVERGKLVSSGRRTDRCLESAAAVKEDLQKGKEEEVKKNAARRLVR